MNVQPMTLDLNSLKAPQKSNNQEVSSKKEDQFSSILEKSREKQETPSKPKVTNEKEKVTETKNEKVENDPKAPVTKEASKSKETALEDEVLSKEINDKATQAIADLLGITMTELDQILATMQIGISDLLKGDNLQQLIMQVHGASEPMDLLLIPEVASKIKAITSVVEEYTANTANTVVAEPDIGPLAAKPVEVTAETVLQETSVKPEVQAATGSQQKNSEEAPKVTAESTTVGAETENVTKINVAKPNDDNLSQNEEQSTPNQNNSASQFLDQLSQSMGEAFQTQNTQINEAFEVTATRNDPVNPRMVLDQIIEKIKVSSLENEAQMSIQLKPEHLGKLSMEVVSRQGVMTAHITVENEKTKAILEQNMQILRDSLEAKGLVIEELEVTVGQNQSDNQQAYGNAKPNRKISHIINTMMNEDALEEEIKPDNLFDNKTNEVDFIA